MHIPDGFLNHGTAGSLMGVAVTAVGFALRKVRKAFLEKVPVWRAKLATFPDFGESASVSFQNRLSKMGQEKMWRMATIGSLIFSSQMVNFPITGGTSGHLLGGVLAALILGPFEALIVMTVVLSAQAFVFGDGGILALGANIFNMGIIGALGGYYYFKFLTKGKKGLRKVFLKSAFVSAWVSVVLAAVMASLEIAFSGTKPLMTVLPAMTLTHIMIGLVEGCITVGVLYFLQKKNFPLAVFTQKETYEEA